MNLEKRGVEIAHLKGRIICSEETLFERMDQPVRMKKDPYFDIAVNEIQHITGYHKKKIR